ncbi:divergent polysaccharide deacetylase family protein [Bowmanella denitrificans]|uniref:divergent polysaccharide deacetylase family protein n=1 Tax=Bowmanella denitrificans TaxID=366582 RepID=UPI001FE568C3|nr:divergent polysaccharide deacetylase family protein [Bowmanella denitrificans]
MLIKYACALLILLTALPVWAGRVVVIIDDMGYRKDDSQAFALPAEVTFAILPHTPFSQTYADLAKSQRRDVILHMPMEALAGNKLGPGALTSDMASDSIQHELSAALQSVPNAIGLNNHMGSKLTQLSQPMDVTMRFLRERQMFFVDSRTTRFSKAEQIAHRHGVLSAHRHVFLDHIQSEEHIQAQFERLIRIARKYPYAIGIGHPYKETLVFLQTRLPQLEEMGIELLPISELMREKHLALAEQAVSQPLTE